MSRTRYLIAGLGSIGSRHLTNLRRCDPSGHITVYRMHTPPGTGILPEGADACVHTLSSALEARPNVVLIAGPANTHISLARAFAENGAHLFIEKPLSNTLDQIEELIGLVRRNSLIATVGYNLRFHPAIRYLREALARNDFGRLVSLRAHVGMYLPDWRPHTDYRTGPSAQKQLGGGAIFELSHELDYAMWIAGDVVDVTARAAKLSNLEIDVEDLAEISLGFGSGAIGSVHLNMLERTMTRWCSLIGLNGCATWDAIDQTVHTHIINQTEAKKTLHFKEERNETFLAELRHFLNCVLTGSEPLISLGEGRRVVEIALAAKRSAQERRTIEV